MTDTNAVEQAINELNQFAKTIELCIEGSDWETLSEVLVLRQACLERVFTESVAHHQQDALKQLASSILQQDAIFQDQIQQQKDLASQQQQTLEIGKRAVKAYGQ